MALDVATAGLLEQMAAAGGKALHEGSPADARELSKSFAAMAGPAPEMARSDNFELPVPDGSIPVRVLVPKQGVRGVIVFYHGGGWVIGTIDEWDTVARKLAERTSCAVVLPEYRLAPEHRYPIAVDDSYAALEWTAERLNEISGGVDVPLMVAGDSAGGNLAAVMAQRARDRNGPELALQILIYPVTDHDFHRSSYTDPENQLILTGEAMGWFWDHYAPDAALRSEPDASPLGAASFAGLPPAVVLTAEHDVLRDEGEAYAQKLEEAGVSVDFKRHAGQTHGFFTLLMLPGSERGYQQVVKAVQACTIGHARNKVARSQG
ncbi:MAG: acetyl esterase [Acidimicrobiales bacterium]|jgi:acetyl esterase